MHIEQVTDNKREYLPLLLLGDEQERMVDRYLDRCDLYILWDNDVRGVCAVTLEGNHTCEVKNLAITPTHQRKGYGRALLEYVCAAYAGRCAAVLLGTGESEATLPFYRACGFHYDHRIKNFFTENYDHPIFEGGVQLTDMVYLRRALPGGKGEEATP